MAGGMETQKLKRKREGVEAQRKKAKVQNASSAAVATPPTQSQTASETKVVVTKVVVNGGSDISGTPSRSQEKGKTPPHVPAASALVDATADDVVAGVSRTKQKKADRQVKNLEKKKNRRERKQKDGEQQEEERKRPLPPVVNGDSGAHGETNTKTISDNVLPEEQLDQALPRDIHGQVDKEITKGKNKEGISASTVTPQTSGKTRKKVKKSKSLAPWFASPAFGGWFLPQDPVFSADEKHLMLANEGSLQVYSTESSLLGNTLRIGSGYLSAYALSSTNPNRVYTANTSGLIILWDWVDSKKIGRWDIGANVRHMAVVPQPESKQDLVYCHESSTSHVVSVHALRTREQSSQTETKIILKTTDPITGIQVLLEGKVVVVTTPRSVLVGKRLKAQRTALQEFEYRWREFRTSQRITTFNAYNRLPDQLEKNKQSNQDPKDHIDLAIGDREGVIHLFEDILSSFATIEKNHKTGGIVETLADTLRPKRLHWHRETVGSLKWSRDGNYLISGGEETVMVIWQLSTGKQQFLPHLTAAIENIVLSPTGTSYAVSLANNSALVLSTTELDAKTNIIGIQSRRIDLEQMPPESTNGTYTYQRFAQVPMVVDPRNPMRVLFTAPSSQPHSQVLRAPEPYLQTIDIATQRAVGGQALTRNNATDLSMGPDGRKIPEPNVEFLQISEDGQWLATVDEWTPPRTDFQYVDEGNADFKEEERTYRREFHLKLWKRDEKNLQWVLESRIDAPHFITTVGAHARVLDLVSDPSGAGFATVGEDGFVRIWRPKTRGYDGVVVRGARENGQVTWSLEREVALSSSLDLLEPGHSGETSLAPQVARLGFSSDGSTLAVGVSWASEVDSGVIHIIDAATGIIRRSITELDVTTLSCLGILGRHLIVVGESIIVWDLVVDELVKCTSLRSPGIDQWERIPLLRLAINETDRTFAVAHPQFEMPSKKFRPFKKCSTTIHVYDTNQSEALWSYTAPDIVLALVAAKEGKGYIMLDSRSRIQILGRQNAPLQLITPPPESMPALKANTTEGDEVESDDEEGDNAASGSLATLSDDEGALGASENDKPVVRPEKLQQIFDSGPSHALPPVKDLFNAVLNLYARKPRAVPAA